MVAACSTAFFLASYQVHEKAVMMPLLPLAALAHRLPLTAAAANLLGVWSVWPLLSKDGLLVPAAVMCVLYTAVAWPSAEEVEAEEGVEEEEEEEGVGVEEEEAVGAEEGVKNQSI